MSKKNNDSVERFFRKAVQRYDADFRESDWQKMEKMLDEQAATHSAANLKLWKRLSVGVVSLVVVSASVYFLSILKQEPASVQDSRQTQAAEGKVAPQNERDDNGSAGGLLSLNKNNSLDTPSKENGSTGADSKNDRVEKDSHGTTGDPKSPAATKTVPVVKSKKGISANEISADGRSSIDPTVRKSVETARVAVPNGAADAIETPAGAGTEDLDVKSVSSNVVMNTQAKNSDPTAELQGSVPVTGTIAPSTTVRDDQVKPLENNTDFTKVAGAVSDNTSEIVNHRSIERTGAAPVVAPSEDVAGDEKPADKNTGNKGNILSHDVSQDSVAKEDIAALAPEAVSEDEASGEEDEALRIPSRWSVALTVAPDFSMTNFGQMSGPGETFGLQIGYHVFKRITVNTGLLKSTKKYEGYGDDYAPPANYWRNRTNGVVPDEIYGKCSILEIPLIVQYDLIQAGRSRFYAAAGASTYLMTSESYTYTFETANPNAAEGWSSDKSSTYPFGIGHISIAYERTITPRLSLGVEPFLKIPFNDIGWARIELFTTGAYFNLRYRFFRRALTTNE